MKKWTDKLPYFLFGIGIIMDIFVNLTGVYMISVTESYMDYIFAGIITVSVLCFSFVALISGFLEKTYLGYKLRDIIQFSSSPLNIKKYISISLATIVIGMALLAGEFIVSCANSMTALLLALVYLEGNIAFEIYDMITNEKHICDLVKEHFSISVRVKEMNFEEFQAHTNKIICALTVCTSENDPDGKDKVCDMLAELGEQIQKREGQEDYYTYYNYFDSKIKGCMDSFAKVFGFNEMLNSMVKIYTRLSDFKYGRIDLYIVPLNNIRFWDDKMLLEKNYFKQIVEVDLLDAYKRKQISNSEVERILYEYFKSIMGNCICTKNVRDQLVEFYISELMKLYWKTNEDGIEPDINSLLNVLKYFVLENNNIEERNYVFKVIIKQAFYNNIQYNKKKYFDFLALFFQAFYAYIFLEKETLNEKYRKSLRDTFLIEFSSDTIAIMSAALLLRINVQDILLAVGRRIVDEKNLPERRFEHFPSYIMAKTVVWTNEFNIDFLFMLYLIFNDEVGLYSIYKYFLKWDTISDEYKMFVLNQLQNKFDVETGLLQRDFVEQYMQYSVLLKHSISINEQIQKKIFEHIMEEHTKLNREKIEKQEPICQDMDYLDVVEIIDELMKKDRIVGWNPEYFSECYVKFVMPDCLCRKEYRTIQKTARAIQQGIIGAVQRYIRQCANKLVLSFDINGVRKLLAFICENDYNARNYTFTDDLALSKFKNETDFIRLEEEQNSIELVNTPQFHENLFFTKEEFCFNVKISKIEFIDLSEKECAEFLEESKCYNGLYNVDGALMAKEEAMSCVKKIYCKERYNFKLMISINRSNMTYIEFEH